MKLLPIAIIGASICSLPFVCPASVHAQTQSEMNQTAYANYKKVDAELNRVYKKLMAKQDATGAAKLKKSQRAWIVFRDAEMSFGGNEMRGGSAERFSSMVRASNLPKRELPISVAT